MRIGSDGDRGDAGADGDGCIPSGVWLDGIPLMSYAGKQMNTVKQDFAKISADGG